MNTNKALQQPSTIYKKQILGNPFCMPLKRPVESIDNPNAKPLSGASVKTMDINAPILDGASILNAKEVAESAVKAALSVNVNTSMLGVDSVLNVKDAAEVAVNAGNMFKVAPTQPVHVNVLSAKSNVLTPNLSRPPQKTIREEAYKNAAGISFPANQPSALNGISSRTDSTADRGDIINAPAMSTAHTIPVHGKHANTMSHLTRQAVVQTVPVKSTPKPSVLLKKFG